MQSQSVSNSSQREKVGHTPEHIAEALKVLAGEAYVFLSDDAGRTPIEAPMAARRVGEPEFDDYIQSAHEADFTTVVVPVLAAFSAPSLLAQCKALVAFAESVRPGGRVLESDPDLDAARAVIAQAEGKVSQ